MAKTMGSNVPRRPLILVKRFRFHFNTETIVFRRHIAPVLHDEVMYEVLLKMVDILCHFPLEPKAA